MSPFRRKDPQKNSASFRIAGKDLGDPALQLRRLAASGSRVVLNRTFESSSEGESDYLFRGQSKSGGHPGARLRGSKCVFDVQGYLAHKEPNP